MGKNKSPLPVETQSPSDNKPEPKQEIEIFNFDIARKKLLEGKKISKKEWDNIKIYGEMKEEKLMLHKENGMHYTWIISKGDLEGEDWFVVDK